MAVAIVLPTHPLFKNLTGQPFGRLTVLEYAGRHGKKVISSWRCLCKCGVEKTIVATALQAGTLSCGCLHREVTGDAHRTHGLSKTAEYRVWAKMLERCRDMNDPDYGGRGIRVCAEWGQSFESFIRDMGKRPSAKHEIDRKNNSGNYEPGNCRWATKVMNNRNKRSNHVIEFRGQAMCISEWSEETGIPHYTIEKRLRSGWSIERTLTTVKRTWTRSAAASCT